MMNLITTVQNEYNENVLTHNFNNISNIPWTVANPSLGATLIETEEHGSIDSQAIKVTALSYDTADTQFYPTNQEDYAFLANKTGQYVFSVRVLVPSQGIYTPDVVGTFYWEGIVGGINHTCDFQLTSANGFEYDKVQTIYKVLTLSAGETYTFGCQIDQQALYVPGTLEIYLKDFKMEFVEDRNFEVPTYYTKPNTSGGDNDSIITITAGITILPAHSNVVISSTTPTNFTQLLHDAINYKGKLFKFINKSSKIVTLFGYGVNKIDGSSSYKVNPLTEVTIQSNGVDWVVLSKNREVKLNRTHWSNTITTTTIPNATVFNILTLITNGTKIANGTDVGIDELNIVSNKILVPWTGVVMSHDIRLNGIIAVGTDQAYNLQLRRISDNTIRATDQLIRNADTGKFTANFKTYTGSASDPFITDGFYITLENQSGATVDLITELSLYVETIFR